MTRVTSLLRPGAGSQQWLQVVVSQLWYVRPWCYLIWRLCGWTIHTYFQLEKCIINASYPWFRGYYCLDWAKLKNSKLIWVDLKKISWVKNKYSKILWKTKEGIFKRLPLGKCWARERLFLGRWVPVEMGPCRVSPHPPKCSNSAYWAEWTWILKSFDTMWL